MKYYQHGKSRRKKSQRPIEIKEVKEKEKGKKENKKDENHVPNGLKIFFIEVVIVVATSNVVILNVVSCRGTKL